MKKILLVGGTDANRTRLKEALDDAGHKASAAITRRYTNRWLGRRIKPFDLIVYDLDDAPQDDLFWTELRAAAGATPIVILTSTFDTTDYAAFGMNRVLRQPYTSGDVVQTVNALLA